jgi:hypothetical protein
MWNE